MLRNKDICINLAYQDRRPCDFSVYESMCLLEKRDLEDDLDVCFQESRDYFGDYLLELYPQRTVKLWHCELGKKEQIFNMECDKDIAVVGLSFAQDLNDILLFFQPEMGSEYKMVHIFKPQQERSFFCAHVARDVYTYKICNFPEGRYIIFISEYASELFDLDTQKRIATIKTGEDRPIVYTSVSVGDNRLFFYANNYIQAFRMVPDIELEFERIFNDSIGNVLSMFCYVAIGLYNSKKIQLFNLSCYPNPRKVAEVVVDMQGIMTFLRRSPAHYVYVLKNEQQEVYAYRLNTFKLLFSKKFAKKIEHFDARFVQGDELVSVNLQGGKRLRYEL